MDIDKKAKEYIEKMAKDLSGWNIATLLYSNAEYYLKFFNEKDRAPVIIPVIRRHINDLNSFFLNTNENSFYFHTLTNFLKYSIISNLVEKNIIPQFCVSDAMIAEKGNWMDPVMVNTFSVSFGAKMTNYVVEGLKTLSEKLDGIVEMHRSFDLSDYKESKKDVDSIYGYYQKQKTLTSGGISIKNLQILKAAAVCKIILFEQEKRNQKLTRIVNEIDKEIFHIAVQMHDHTFYVIQIPDFMKSIKELYSHETGAKINTPVRSHLTNDNSVHYDISFSLAHEQHEYVDKVSNHLHQLSPDLKIFYYRDEPIQIGLWGKNQFTYLQQIYLYKFVVGK